MIKQHSAISLLFIGLISLSLSLSTVHSHSAIQASVHESNHPGIEHSVEKDFSHCPICAYIQKVQLPPSVSVPFPGSDNQHTLLADSHQLSGPFQLILRGRSPPFGSGQ
ncbi:MAG: hypothetical protein U5K31_12935 [Balneolaceae bacterium]|nr:hypothetical protein [Balneolaceae bacterium]